MVPEKTERDPVEAAIMAKIAAYTAALESYRAARALDGGVSGVIDVTLGGLSSRPTDLPVGVFRDKSLKEAIQIYLGAGRRKQTNKEIAEGLKAGGFPTTAENFEPTVATALYRLKTDGIILRFPDGWDVASSYPDSLRNRLSKDASPKRSKRAKRGKKVSASAVKGVTVREEATTILKIRRRPKIVSVARPEESEAAS
jgi:hypothetical protein